MGMLFQIYGDTSLTQILGWCMVFVGLILLNELGRRTKWGGILLFVIVPIILTIYFILIHVGLFGSYPCWSIWWSRKPRGYVHGRMVPLL